MPTYPLPTPVVAGQAGHLGHTSELHRRYNESGIYVTDKGAIGDGLADDTAAINSAAAAAAGRVLVFPAGRSFRISSPVTIPPNTTVMAYGARVFNKTGHISLLRLSSGCRLYGMELEGAGYLPTNGNGDGVDLAGTAAVRVTDVVIQDCYIHDVGFYGVYAAFVDRVRVVHCRIFRCGYAGVAGLSADRMLVGWNHVDLGNPIGQGGNAYGIFFSRNSTSNLSTDPRSRWCSATENVVENISIWHGLDTHAGDSCTFAGNVVRNTLRGIAVGSSPDGSGSYVYAPINCTVANNDIDSLAVDGTRAEGISFTGAQGVTTGSEPVQYATGKIVGNTVRNHGQEANHINGSGGIFCYDTDGLVINANSVYQPSPYGIVLAYRNKGFACTGNTVVDPWALVPNATAVEVRSSDNIGLIGGNSYRRGTLSGKPQVLGIGTAVANASGNRITVFVNNDRDAASPLYDPGSKTIST